MSSAVRNQNEALAKLKAYPWLWSRNTTFDACDQALLRAAPVPFLKYGEGIVRTVNHWKYGEGPKHSIWTNEEDVACKRLVGSAGGTLIGYNFPVEAPIRWAEFTVTVKILQPTIHGVYRTGGFLTTKASNIRIFKGPPDGFVEFPCDAMILRNCISTSDTIAGHVGVGHRMWDILCMKTSERFENPWFVVKVLDAGGE